ncbi:hypothetical protein IAU59_006259 [Kwoniella sp. CBS 9459]
MSLSSSFTGLALKEKNGAWFLSAKHVHGDGDSHAVADFPLDLVLGNINGEFRWGNKGFSASAAEVELDGTVLKAMLADSDGEEQEASFDLDDKFVVDEKEGGEPALKAVDVPALVYLPEAFVEVPDQKTAEALDVHFDSIVPLNAGLLAAPSATVKPRFNVQVATGSGDDAKAGYATAGASSESKDIIDGVLAHTVHQANASASVFHVEQTKGGPVEQCKVDILSVGAEAQAESVEIVGVSIPKYAGVDASVNLVKMDAGPFALNLGAGVNTDFGIKGTSVEAHVAGCGVTIGTTIGISAFGSGFSIDFTKLW